MTYAKCTWGSAGIWTSCGQSGCSGATDSYPWYAVDLTYNSTVSGVQLWYRLDNNAVLLAPLAVYVTSAPPPLPGAATALLNATLYGAPCATVAGVSMTTLQVPFAAPCTGRYVIVQQTAYNGPLNPVIGGTYMNLCSLQARSQSSSKPEPNRF